MSVGDPESICCLAPQWMQCKEIAAPSAGKKTVNEKKEKEAERKR